MPDTPFFSIIVISRDDPAGLDATLESVRQQDFTNYEVIVVPKGTSAEADLRRHGIARLVVRTQQASGISDAFNIGLTAATGHWVNFLNGGDLYSLPGTLGLAAGHARDDVAIVAGRAVDAATSVRIPRDAKFKIRDIELVSHQASFFRAKLFKEYGLYSERFRIRMDFEWMLRIPKSTPIAWLDVDLVNFEGRGISSTLPWRSCMEELDALRIHHKGWMRILSLMAFYVPWRTARAQVRKLRNA